MAATARALPLAKTRRTSGWSDERRAKHAAFIRLWAPWKRSTGPKTAAGKAKSSRNATKSTNISSATRAMERAMDAHGRYLADLNGYISLAKNPAQNELLKATLKTTRRRLQRRGIRVMHGLMSALLYAKSWGEMVPVPPSGVHAAAESSYIKMEFTQRRFP